MMKINLHGTAKDGCNFPIIEFERFNIENGKQTIKKNKKKKKLVRKDFHSYLIVEVKSWLVTILPEFLQSGVKIVDIIHGFHHGTTIRDYVRLNFKSEFESKFPNFSVKVIPVEPGRTLLFITFKED